MRQAKLSRESLGSGAEASAWALRAQTQSGKGQCGVKGWRAQALWYACGRGPAGCGCSVGSVVRGQNTRTRSLLAGTMHLGKGGLLGEHSPRGAWPGEWQAQRFCQIVQCTTCTAVQHPSRAVRTGLGDLGSPHTGLLSAASVCPTVPAQDPAYCSSNKMQRGTRVAAPQLTGRGCEPGGQLCEPAAHPTRMAAGNEHCSTTGSNPSAAWACVDAPRPPVDRPPTPQHTQRPEAALRANYRSQ